MKDFKAVRRARRPYDAEREAALLTMGTPLPPRKKVPFVEKTVGMDEDVGVPARADVVIGRPAR